MAAAVVAAAGLQLLHKGGVVGRKDEVVLQDADQLSLRLLLEGGVAGREVEVVLRENADQLSDHGALFPLGTEAVERPAR